MAAATNGSKFQSKEAKYTYGDTDPLALIKKHKEERREFFNSGLVSTTHKNFNTPTQKSMDIMNKYKMTNSKPSYK
jgi:hypothetical protein